MAVVGNPGGSFSHAFTNALHFLTCVFPAAVRPHSAPEYKDETMTVYQVPIHSESESQISLEHIAVVPHHGECG